MAEEKERYKNPPKPDDRSDNVGKLQDMIHDTIENYREAEDYLKLHAEELSPEEIARIKEKNRHRLESIHGMRDEIVDEVEAGNGVDKKD
ncbi:MULTISPECIES: small acid-soluble spore protein Tlp [Thermoanaerobacterium]|uniref:Protein Tlp homolog n=1 Tax=Thermoanaerobacterium xylanolyticum (strain ATCC 49914 / DSM 7097 / LX-11) TaxID=858215 RepID=F6BK00_THEXL|nr:small acid-soluble spore protein Tlp [Thermoanaerobacterium xylanolyticum]AEF18021.1 Small, acid-soluble spore protein tlp [Thermoanaerobacterium xylanolyticum LX-11]